MQQFAGKVAVITGAGSGFGAAFARQAQRLGMRLVLADVQADALDRQVSALGERGADVLGVRCDVSSDADVGRLARAAYDRFGAVNLLVNNAGVAGTGGYLWENSEADWRWTLGVNLMGVANGIRHFVPRMIAAGLDQDSGHIVNSASIAGWLCAPLLGVYNASKAAVVSASETLYHDLKLAGSRIGVSVLCPAFVPTAIFASDRNRPAELANASAPTASQRLARAAGEKAVAGGRLGADEVAAQTFEAIGANRFFVFTHPQIMPMVRARCDAALAGEAPADPYAQRPGARPPRADGTSPR
ncbi:MAG: SDR family NAD(P)-dependent oxidoreductase [Burkholderiales bacterium]|jgi:NAD(P)-dependent dehydrogenase (short-subunit alcohol dehydrogenase family)|nr:SDR family NAD(P)-dependent oxidoreductase [Burkholderiales bacterium]